MTKAIPFLQKAILLSYDPLPFAGGYFFQKAVFRVLTLPLCQGVSCIRAQEIPLGGTTNVKDRRIFQAVPRQRPDAAPL